MRETGILKRCSPAGLSVLAVLFSLFCLPLVQAEDNQANLKPLSVYSSKVTLHGVYPEEVISMKELRDMQMKKRKILIFDARAKKSYDDGHIEQALLPLSENYYRTEELFRTGIIKSMTLDRDKDLADHMNQYPKNIPVVTYCSDGCQAGSVLLLQLKRLGFTDVRVLDDGFQTWQKNGYPVSSRHAR